jgi:hypothetical protein
MWTIMKNTQTVSNLQIVSMIEIIIFRNFIKNSEKEDL